MTELVMCKLIRYTYYCEELFVAKHKSKHSCASAIFYDLGPQVVSRNCKFDYKYNQTVPPVILDGGRQLLLANFYGPRSPKCNSQNGGLPNLLQNSTYAVVPRDFLCDCQLDLEHASVLCQLSSCHHNTSNKLIVAFVVNIAFYEILRQNKPKLLSKIRLHVKTKPQMFDVRLFGDNKGPLDQPTHLRERVSQLGDSGHREHPQIKVKTTEKTLLTKTQNNIMVITCTFLATLVCVGLVFLAVRHVKLKALVTGLALVTAAPVTEAN